MRNFVCLAAVAMLVAASAATPVLAAGEREQSTLRDEAVQQVAVEAKPTASVIVAPRHHAARPVVTHIVSHGRPHAAVVAVVRSHRREVAWNSLIMGTRY